MKNLLFCSLSATLSREMEARVASVLGGIARSMAPSGLKKALSFRVVELALRDDDAVRSYPPARGQQWPVRLCLVPELVEQLVEVLKGRYQDGIQPIAELAVEVPKISCQEFFEALEGVLQEWISEEKFDKVVLLERILEKDCAQIGVPRERVQQRSAEKEILEIFEKGAHFGAYTDRRRANAADCGRDRRSGGVSPA